MAKNYGTRQFFGVSNEATFLKAMQALIDQVPAVGVFASDNLFTHGRNLSFLDDAPLMSAFNEHANISIEKAILWRTAVLTWAARQGLRLDGDFVECGCYRGTSARILIDATNLIATGKKFYIYDSFAKDPRMPDLSAEQFEEKVRQRFSSFANVVVTAGMVPSVLEKVSPEKISFMHLDMNNAAAELGALEKLFVRMVPGAVLILDDYGWHQYREQKVVEDNFLAALGYEVLELPTGQGLVVR